MPDWRPRRGCPRPLTPRWRLPTVGRVKARFVGFGEIEIDGRRYARDVVVERGRVSRRHKGPSKARRDEFGHTPLTLEESIPWRCRRLIVGTGADGGLPIVPEIRDEARRRDVELIAVPTDEACRLLAAADPEETAAILHVTC